MLTNQEIQDLIKSPKEIETKIPVKEYKDDGTNKGCSLTLQTSEGKSFGVFIRQNNTFIENFSLGLRHNDRELGPLTLVRYNGPHGEVSRSQDGHYAKPHIHRITAAEIGSGSTQPQESHREITNEYGTFQQALSAFFNDLSVRNYLQYFPTLRQIELC